MFYKRIITLLMFIIYSLLNLTEMKLRPYFRRKCFSPVIKDFLNDIAFTNYYIKIWVGYSSETRLGFTP